MPAIETDALTRTFGDLVAVDALSLTVDRGEVFGFLGPNGAGKSTTIDVLLGFTAPTSGTARVLGRDVATDSRAIKQRIGLLPEGYGVYENLTGREHVVSAIQTKGADDDPDAILERVGLSPEDARRPAGDYSKGMTQRLGLGIALVDDPELLILDEPSSGLDPNGIRLLRDIVAEEAERGATVFFSSHVLDEVERVCDRVGIMQQGRLVAVDEVEDLRAELGAGSVVTATVDDPGPVTPDDVAAVDGVTDATVDGTTVRVQCARPGAKMPALRRIDDAATVVDVGVEDASLETLFEEFTADTGSPSSSDGAGADASADAAPSVAGDGGERA